MFFCLGIKIKKSDHSVFFIFLNDKSVDDVSLDDSYSRELKLYKDILNENDLQKRISFSFPNHNDGNNIINDDNDNDEDKDKDKGKVEVKNLDNLDSIHIK